MIEEDEYMALGVSREGTSNMIGSDATIAYVNGYLAFVDDYNITARYKFHNQDF